LEAGCAVIAGAIAAIAAGPDDPPPPHATMPSGNMSPMKQLNFATLRRMRSRWERGMNCEDAIMNPYKCDSAAEVPLSPHVEQGLPSVRAQNGRINPAANSCDS
jgi:hypothetical protein